MNYICYGNFVEEHIWRLNTACDIVLLRTIIKLRNKQYNLYKDFIPLSYHG